MKQKLRFLWMKLAVPLLEPWKAIKGRGFHYVAWLLGLPIIGLAGFWLPLGLAGAMGNPLNDVFKQLLYGGTLASFSLVILAEGILGILMVEKSGTNVTALGIRGTVYVWSIGLIILLAGVMACEVPLNSGRHVAISVHVSLAVFALITAAYLYCFRFPSWEKGVGDIKEEEDNEVNKLGKDAMHQSTDGVVKL